ncbi:hypothetical protein H9Q69_010000 [Fusarium xylarioides]|uniref:Uncharacterized protein n=1 Tax=Fusarium xylarioides TaxID=221167 RepID=A0A9P7I042_9HYPO|nr:hypothetical protein H9Q70_010754 [Fusarium xylarioides]KAG5766467.1 hypothetical protein H9Q72_005461 [Fusarium xylarioides]KAG5774676.1 hypothetical protein H9Q73_011655 [Fusarium xylarioides]KAG5790952.1 hypothetical protein H9Q69_010000 [Fusarium xylarioides]KAG5811538.1 hypothetical protein H9Q71_004820 [Fusarium xylarioides]
MDAEFVGYGSIARQDRELAEWHRNADYSIVHPPNNKIPWHVPGHVPEGLRVLKTQDYEVLGEVSVTCAAKYLSFASEADFLSYVDIVVPDIVGPAIDIMHYHGRYEERKISAYSDTSFGLLPSAQNQDLIAHVQSQNVHSVWLRSGQGPPTREPMLLLEFFRENTAVREWLATLVTLLTEPKLIPTNRLVPPECFVEREEFLWRSLFLLAHAVQIMVFAPVYWREDGSYKSTDSYARRFPLGFPRPSPNDDKVFGEYTLDDLYRAILLQHFLFRQRYGRENEKRYRDPLSTTPPKADSSWLGYSAGRSEPPWVEESNFSSVTRSRIMRLPRELQIRIVELASSPKVTPTLLNRPKELRRYSRVQSTWEDSTLALKLSSRMMYRLAIAEQNVEGVVDQRVVFRMNLDIDTLRVFDMALPDFITPDGPSVLPVRRLISISKIEFRQRTTDRDIMWHFESPVGEALALENLPKLDEFTVIFPNVTGSWMIEGLPLVRPQTHISDSAHTGIKWQFNTGLYPVPRWERHHDDHFNDSYIPHMHLDDPIPDEVIPYVGKWGYERSPGVIGGYWASFQYFEEPRDVYFAPLSWKEVEPLVKGPFGENGREAFYEDHTPRFVAKLRIIRQGATPPTGWIKVEEVQPEDPNWKRQLLNTWKSVWYTLTGRRSLNYLDDLSEPCHYYLRQT